jgi:hypothetical protein
VEKILSDPPRSRVPMVIARTRSGLPRDLNDYLRSEPILVSLTEYVIGVQCVCLLPRPEGQQRKRCRLGH